MSFVKRLCMFHLRVRPKRNAAFGEIAIPFLLAAIPLAAVLPRAAIAQVTGPAITQGPHTVPIAERPTPAVCMWRGPSVRINPVTAPQLNPSRPSLAGWLLSGMPNPGKRYAIKVAEGVYEGETIAAQGDDRSARRICGGRLEAGYSAAWDSARRRQAASRARAFE